MKSGQRRPRLAWAILFCFLVIAVCAGTCAIPILTQPDPAAFLKAIPLGSKLSELDKYLGKGYNNSSVQRWIPYKEKKAVGTYKTSPYGKFEVRGLGEYGSWDASQAERDSFTGEINFFHLSAVIPDDLAPSWVMSLTYVNGVLKEKDYGQLPG